MVLLATRGLAAVAATAVLLSTSCGPAPPESPAILRWTLGIGGDTQLARRVEEDTLRSEDLTHAFGDMVPALRGFDLLFVNLECQISARGAPVDKGEEAPFYFRASPRMADALSEVGVDVVTVANNHGMDYGPAALLETISLLRERGIVVVGGGRDLAEAAAPGLVLAGGVQVAFVGCNATPPLLGAGAREPGLNSVSAEESDRFLARAAESLAVARATGAEVFVFTVHWGPNYRTAPSVVHRELARRVLALGYDAFIGHGAHQFLGVEVYGGKPIIHDAGNFAVDFESRLPHWNERNLLFVLHFNGRTLDHLEGRPMLRQGTRTDFAAGAMAEAICERFVELSARLGTTVEHTPENRVSVRLGR